MIAVLTLVSEVGAAPFQQSGGLVVMEGENFHALAVNSDPNGYNWQAATAVSGYVGSGYVDTPLPHNPQGEWSAGCEASYNINFTSTGNHVVWLRRYAVDGTENSTFVGLDGTASSSVDNTTSYGSWVWKNLGTVTVSSTGEHTFQLRRREQGYKVDRVLLTTDTGYTPSGNGPAESSQGSAPAAPSSLNATAVSSSQINLAWTDNSADETGFKVDRKKGSGGTYGQIDTTGANTTTYGDTGLDASTTYFYKVRATNASGDSAYSNEASASTDVETYDGLVARFSPNVVSYWKFQNTGTDEQGTQNATITGSPELNVPTIVDLDTIAEGASADGEVIAWPDALGIYADVPHNAAHKTAAGTIVVTFQADSLNEKSTLVAADANSAAGGLSVEVNTDGSSRAFLKNSGGSTVILTGVAGDVQLNQAYTQIFKWGTGGLSLALYNDAGTLVRRVTNALTDGVTGTSPIRFGAWHTGNFIGHVGPYGRVVWLSRRISDAEEADLARAKTIARGGDTEAPTVSVTAPGEGAFLAGTNVSVTADASDNIGVVGVQFKLDGANLGAEDTTSPYSITWDTTTATDGAHALTAVARDAATNSTISTAVNVTVDNAAPTVSITAPSEGANVAGTSVSVTADATDSVGVVGVQFKLDGANLGTEDTTSPYSITWDTTTATDGAHALTAVARDAATNSTISTAVNVTVDNAAPTVSVTSPADQATVSGAISVTADASDNVGVVGVQFKLDGVNLGSEDTTSPYSVNWDTTTTTDGAHALTAVARDAAGNSTTSATVNVTVDNAAGGGGAFQQSGGQVVMEGENFHALAVNSDPNGYNWQAATAVSGYVGSGYVDTPLPHNPQGEWSAGCEASYEVDFNSTGSHVVWLRRYAVDGTENSTFVGLDGVASSTVDNTADYGSWVWKNLGTVSVSSTGVHTFQLRRREQGYKVDRIILTTDTGYTPTGNGPAESPQGGGGGSDTYDSRVASFAPNVVSYWKFQNNGTDEQGTQNATITGSPELNVPTIVDLDTIAEGASADGEVIAWSGGTSEYAEAAHNAAHKTAQGTIVVTFQHDALAEKSVLVAADSNSAAGGLSVEVNTNGSSRAFLKNASGSAVILTGQAGDVQLDQAYTQIFKWGTGGLSLALYNDAGVLVRRVTDPLTDGVTGTSTIRFGAWHTDATHHDGPYGRVVWLDRRISDTEEADLARARTITHGSGGGTGSGFPILEPDGGPGTLVTTFKDNGELTGTTMRVPVTGGNARYDFRGTGKSTPLKNTPPTSADDWDGNRCLIRLDTINGAATHDGAYFGGGYGICPNMLADYDWGPLYDSTNQPRPLVQIRGEGLKNIIWDGLRAHALGWDVYSTGSQDGAHLGVRNQTFRRFAITLQRDDCFELDDRTDGCIVEDGYAEGMVFISSRNPASFDGSARLTTVRHNLAYALPVRVDNKPNTVAFFFKLDSKSPDFLLTDNIFAVPAHDNIQNNSNGYGPFRDLVHHNRLDPSSSGNIICWLGSGSYPYNVPSGFTLQTGSTAQNTWNNALAAFWSTFPGHRFSFDPPAP